MHLREKVPVEPVKLHGAPPLVEAVGHPLGVVVDGEQPDNVGQVHLRAAPIIVPGLRVGLRAALAPVVALKQQAGDGQDRKAASHSEVPDPALVIRSHRRCPGRQAPV